MPIRLSLPDPPIRKALNTAAAAVKALIVERVFPDAGGTSRTRGGSNVKALSPKYRRYKSGEGAVLKRRKAPKGKGPLVEGRRLTARSATADHRLTDKTAKEFGVVSESADRIVLGWRTSRGKSVARALAQRDDVLPASSAEVTAAQEAAAVLLRDWVRSVKVGGTIEVRLGR